MELYQQKIIETAIVIFLYFLIRNLSSKIIEKNLSNQSLVSTRGVVIRKVVNFVLLSVSLIFIFLIWGVKQSDLALFIGSAITIVGVAFFAQWSLLSNITSSIILFFNHPIRINDSIVILEGKEYVLEGKVISIGIFFITLQTDEDEEITLPNNVFIQKSIKRKNDPSQVKQ